jgi:drug/metabolite transporter (DMT)-like permease
VHEWRFSQPPLPSSFIMPSKRISIILAFAAVYLIWGSTYLGILFAIQSIPPFLMAGARFFICGLIMYAAARIGGASKPTPITWRSALVVGGCLLLCGNGAVSISEQWVPSGLASLLVATVPIYMALLGWLTGISPRPAPIVWLGLIGGFLGVGVLVGPALTNLSSSNHLALGMCILLIGSLIWSIGSLYSRTAISSPSLILAAGQQMICGGTLLFLMGLAFGEPRHFDFAKVTPLSVWAFLYLVAIGALIGYTAYFWLLRHCDPAKVATYAYINPVVAVLLGTLFAHETLSLRTIVGAGMIVGSVAVVITAQQLAPRDSRPVTAAPKAVDCAT